MSTATSFLQGATPVIIAVVSGLVGLLAGLLIEKYRSKLKNLSRYHNSQFQQYSQLWKSLYRLKKSADNLWNKANQENLKNFTYQLNETEIKINENSILIEKEHLKNLKEIIGTFWDFSFGKVKLISLRNNPNDFDNRRILNIQLVISRNAKIKDKYDSLIDEIETSFRKQIKTPNV